MHPFTDAEFEALIAPPTPTAARARAVVEEWSSPELVHHCLRSWVWAIALAESEKRAFDRELLYVAAMLHDIGLDTEFDAHAVPFEAAGGAVGWVFAAGAGWPPARCARVQQIIERHMWTAVDPELDIEGYLLETATSLDVGGASPERWDAAFLRDVERRLPRGDFTHHFASSIAEQAERKPLSQAHRLHASGRVLAGGDVWCGLEASTPLG
ncbi:HD domain-containing protein [Microbacterium sp. C7(2022)]|uniref:HD domain-containing protein n=1 Tax=Microbacterium sp. C7(2022) TaxID=2992759 RepID=UPI00237A317E|nr:HD domain-containing protein [Microbacterium sp. C7(2022)]MDE0546145.1 HD domain-containing protein [Microbacterium sp. C7(2022)]